MRGFRNPKRNIMAKCSVCGKPATTQITITENGQRRQLMLCDEHHMQFMARHQRSLSPLESLFHSGLFERLFDEGWSPFESAGTDSERAGRSAPERASSSAAGVSGRSEAAGGPD